MRGRKVPKFDKYEVDEKKEDMKNKNGKEK
jgi:hypothetical protein